MCACVLELDLHDFFFFFFNSITNSFEWDNYQFLRNIFNMPQSYFLFQIIINFLNNTWYLKISLNPMMCLALTKIYEVHDKLRYYEETRNILASLSWSINFRLSLFLLFFFIFYYSLWKFNTLN